MRGSSASITRRIRSPTATARLSDGRRAAIRIAGHEDGGSIQQWLAMSRATSFAGFRQALAMAALPAANTMYADREGNIYYQHGNAVPRRHRAADWSQPLDGADARTEWDGYHSLDELPELINPPAGWIQNTNSSPFGATGVQGNPDPARYRAYMAPEPDNARARASRRLLARTALWTFADWQAAAFDGYVLEAETAVPRIADEWERLGAMDPERARTLDPYVDELRSWDYRSAVGSPAMTLFAAWFERIAEPGALDGQWPNVRALEQAVADIGNVWGRTRVTWGEVNRLQRIHTSGTPPFDPALPSLPVQGGPGALGIVFNFESRIGPDGRRRYGVRGHSWVGAIEFGDTVRARTIVNFGQSADSLSPHWFDQAPLYARGEMKTLWFLPEEIEAARTVRYRPGEEPRARH
jgi:acyl-homoserine-lactone acylase